MKTKFYLRTWLALSICLMQHLHSQTSKLKTSDGNREASSKQILVKLGMPKEAKDKITSGSAELQALAFQMANRANELRMEAGRALNENKKAQLEEADGLDKLSILMQIEAFELSGAINAGRFNGNRQAIRALFMTVSLEETIYESTIRLLNDAERNMKLALEMREEGNAEKYPAVKLGRLSNADEKEFLALHEQDEVLNIMQKNKRSALSLR